MSARKTPKIAIVAGEQSGQLLAADSIAELNQLLGEPVLLCGVGGDALTKMGLKSLFDPDEIALTGISSVIKKLPSLMRRIRQTADAIIAENPDCLLLVDSPDFSLRVAKRVKKQRPDLPIIKYVAPTVWAWRPARASKMNAYIDAILAILPFEPKVMEDLGGPKTHYVGHRLIADQALAETYNHNLARKQKADKAKVLVLPGSRRGEIKALMDDFGKTIDLLAQRGHRLDVHLPTLPHLRTEIVQRTAHWSVKPIITTGREMQIQAYKDADVALAASGTVTLELALAGVPAISCYRLDPLMKLVRSLITTWSAALPNLIADRPVIQEFYNEFVRPGILARNMEVLIVPDSLMRKHVLRGYEDVREKMTLDIDASAKAAQIIASYLK